jgi:signal transduction histidine kinase/DNA-binding response OmpR family regulator
MNQSNDQAREVVELRERLSRLSEASLRINESLDLETVLQGVLDSARSLTGAMYGVITVMGDSGHVQPFLTSGMDDTESRQLQDLPGGMEYFNYLNSIKEPLRLRDFHGYMTAQGLAEVRPPMPTSPSMSFLGVPIRHLGEVVGNFYLAEREGGGEFTREDEETLVTFASQAALVIANARRYREEQRARADLNTLINTAPVGVLVFDAKTRDLVSSNQETKRIVRGLSAPGHSLPELLSVMTFRRPDGREIPLQELPTERAVRSGETVRAEEVVIQLPDGQTVTTLCNATPIFSEEGEVVSVVATLQDMTPLEELERLRAEFLGMVSHELRTPLSAIKGSITTLLTASSDLDPAEMTQFFRIIDQQSDNMHHLISDLLDVARIETGTLSVSVEPTEVTALVDEAKTKFISAGGERSLHIDLEQDLPRIVADRRRIVQVLNNLLSNSSRYSPLGSDIRVVAVRDGVHVAVSVIDEGMGLPAESLPHLFRKFSRLNVEDRGREIEGSGLGLAICKGIVEAHGGRIWAESDGAGLGTRFTFTIPAVEEVATPQAQLSGRTGQSESGQERILVVDDDPQTLRYVRDALTNSGYVPIVTGDPGEVLRLVEDQRPNLVLLDLVLPDSDGMDLMKDILEIADVPVIFLSAYGQDGVIARAFDLGAADYVVKPFSPTELVARIRAALRRRIPPDQEEPSKPYVMGDLSINYAERGVVLAERPIQLTALEYRMLFELSVHAGQVLTYDHLLQRIWGPANYGDLRPMRTVVRSLRRKLGDDARNPRYIFNEPRIGYRMAKP